MTATISPREFRGALTSQTGNPLTGGPFRKGVGRLYDPASDCHCVIGAACVLAGIEPDGHVLQPPEMRGMDRRRDPRLRRRMASGALTRRDRDGIGGRECRYVGPLSNGRIVFELGGFMHSAHPKEVSPAPKAVELPEGWALMDTDDLVEGVHEVYDPLFPGAPWIELDRADFDYPCLVVARERGDQ